MKKLISFDFIEFRTLRYVLECSIFFGVRLENPKTNKQVEGEGWGGGRRGPFNRDLRVKSDVAQNLIDDSFSNFDCQKTFPYEEF